MLKKYLPHLDKKQNTINIEIWLLMVYFEK